MAKIKNPFKKQSITDTAINVAIGGAGNVLFDTVWGYLPDSVTSLGSTAKNAIKLVGGAVAGSMTSNKYLRAMTDGFAVVGASDLVSGLINGESDSGSGSGDGANGLPGGTIGRIPRYGSRKFRGAPRTGRVAGLQDFQTV